MFFSRLHGQWPRSRRSFTLIEILAAMAVMEVMAVSVMMMFTFGNRSLTMIQEDMIVTNVLQAKVEEIKGQEFSKNVTATDVFMAPYTQYRLDVSQATNYGGNQYLKRVVVTCRWTTALGTNKQDSVCFLVSDR